ncbi:MAG: GNAT family N-acetyltransferase [Candidatus Odinarchaeota archaeon]
MVQINKENEITLLQELLTNDWPAREHYFLNGWIVRFTDGITDRANSVLPNYYSGSSVLDDISLVEKLYKERGLRPTFQVADHALPADLAGHLLSRGYKSHSETAVLVGQLVGWTRLQVNASFQYADVTDNPEQWFESLTSLSQSDEKRTREKKDIISRIPSSRKALFIAVDGEKEAAGVVLGVADRGYLCIFDLIVHPRHRRQGIARSLMTILGSWSMKKGINRVFLQVLADNNPAIVLYKNLGMEFRYGYRYFLEPAK